MGTCVSKCYPGDSTSKPPPAPAKEAAVAAHPPPLPLEGAASPSSPTITSSLSLASTSNSSSSSSSSSADCSSSRGLVLLPSSSNSKSSREWDVVVLDPKSYYHHCSKLTSSVHHPGTMPKAKPKRARSVSPMPKLTSSVHHPGTMPKAKPKQQQHKRQKPAAEREALLVWQSTEPSRYNRTPGTRVTADDLTNPVIAMDCFIFL